MKRALLIATGTVGGLGAVLAITPPQLGSTSAINIADTPSKAVTSGTTAAAPASSSSTAVTKKSVPNNSSTAAGVEQTTPAAAATKSINGEFTGPSVFVNYGNVQVKITVVDGRITDAVAVKAPSGRNDRWTNMAVPILKEQTLKAQSADIQGASGASYTSYGWYTSLQGALADAGL
jgi:uncharacterized protein with FMN-binding domain